MSDVYYRTVRTVTNVLLFLENVAGAAYNEIAEVQLADGSVVKGQVLDAGEKFTVIQSFGGTSGMDTKSTKVRLTGDTAKIPMSSDILGRIFDGNGNVIDGGPSIYGGNLMDVNGMPINPYSRDEPSEFIQTGVSAIDGMNTLARGQKLPIFSASGLRHNDLTAQARTLGKGEKFAVVFGGIGLTSEEANFFRKEFGKSGSLGRTVAFLNLASSPSVERLLLPRMTLTAAEYLAYEMDMHVLVILSDMTNYAEALREISAARDEVPSRRGYPGYMYTDLASIFERAGKIKDKKGSITQFPIVTMPGDDITHPIPDLTGYITEGQIVMSRELDKKGIYPNVDVLSSRSRLMNQAIGEGKTRDDHRDLSNQLFASYARGKDLHNLAQVVGEGALTESDKKFVEFSNKFEEEFITQDYEENRDISKTLDIGWRLLSLLDKNEMKRLKDSEIRKYGQWEK
jgi:V/A-type H+-transporting ATPase subunit B